ncbi:hypothetical protein CSPX01_02757 [Colletotrichum filicis]|nr:hypothetical protein CSPX01_02757 [Colletotrichum filicis]
MGMGLTEVIPSRIMPSSTSSFTGYGNDNKDNVWSMVVSPELTIAELLILHSSVEISEIASVWKLRGVVEVQSSLWKWEADMFMTQRKSRREPTIISRTFDRKGLWPESNDELIGQTSEK